MIAHDAIRRAKRAMPAGNSLDKLAYSAVSQATWSGCPPEALTDQALRWANIMEQRERYQAALAVPPGESQFETNIIFRDNPVTPHLVIEPLTEEEVRDANAWKLAYLQRLRREKTDQSYIDAYLKVWNLSTNEVFGATSW